MIYSVCYCILPAE